MRKFRLLVAALASLALVGCTSHVPEATTPATTATPPPRVVTPPCAIVPGSGSMGSSLKCRLSLQLNQTAAPGGQTGIDLSNNDPSFGRWRTIRRFESFVYLKVNEGAGFRDTTASRMAREARAAGLLVGGYDFQHVCEASASAEARTFIADARADGLLDGRGVLPATADFERGSGCNARVWLAEWSNTVRRITHDAVYSDPGYYVPMVGCFTDANYGWVADLGGFQLLCSLHTVFQQYSWTAWDGVAHVDGDVFLGSYKQLQALAGVTPPKPKPTHAQLRAELKRQIERRASERAFLERHHCRQPPWHTAVGLSGRPNGHYEHACHVELKHGQETNHLIHELEREL